MNDKVPGETNCLGWCNKRFYSPDKRTVRFCAKCREKRGNASASMSRMETRLIAQTGGGCKDTLTEAI